LFINTNDRTVNLLNVSNINILNDTLRIIFNMNYSIKIDRNRKQKMISDYVYWDSDTIEEFETNLSILRDSRYFDENFIDQYADKGYINLNEISSIKYADHRNRVIFNLSHPITFTDNHGNERLTSEFVYNNCDTTETYNEYKQYIQEQTEGDQYGTTEH